MYIGEDSFIDWSSTPYWARIHFVENNGMAFGLELWEPYGKLTLSLFRIIAVGFLIYFIRKLLEAKASLGLLISFALILAGAIGNILDSAFYGLIFSASPHHMSTVAEMFPEQGGYASFLHGKVVDMFYFPMYDGFLPEWFPIWGGESFEFFKPVFNVADVSISTGVISILLFQRSFFSAEHEQFGKKIEAVPEVENSALAQNETTTEVDSEAEIEPTKIESENYNPSDGQADHTNTDDSKV